jgi:cytochrome c oxidase assembly factor CtaG
MWDSWTWRADVLGILTVLAALYLRGWVILRSGRHRPAASSSELLAYLSGLGVTGVALLSPLAVFQRYLLSAHMVQHELLIIVGPSLVLLGRPLATALWGIPPGFRHGIGRLLRPEAPLRRMFDRLEQPSMAWTVSTGLLWVWHIPAIYNAVKTNGLLHDAQHIAFFLSGLTFWWPIIQAPPVTSRMTLPFRVGYLLAGMTQRSLLGGIIALSPGVLYGHYSLVPRLSMLSPLDDQHLAGSIMWFASGVVLLIATVIVIWQTPEDQPLPATMISREGRLSCVHGALTSADGVQGIAGL